MKILRILSLLVAMSILFTACKKDDQDNCIQGNGDLTVDTRDIGYFNMVYAVGAFDISFSQTTNTRIDLFGDSNVFPVIQTTIDDNLLFIRSVKDQCYSTQNNIEVTLTAPEFRGVTMNGAGKIEAHNINNYDLYYETDGSVNINSSFDVEYFRAAIYGTGNASLVGSADQAELIIAGTGSMLASLLEVDQCEITITGVGDVRIHVNEILDVTITGSGNVYYTGDPGTINTNITGTGQVIKEG